MTDVQTSPAAPPAPAAGPAPVAARPAEPARPRAAAPVAESASANAPLQQRIDLGARMMKTMQAQLHRAEALLTALRAHEERLSGACARAERVAHGLDARAAEAARRTPVDAGSPMREPTVAPARVAEQAPGSVATPPAQSPPAPATPPAAGASGAGDAETVEDIRALHTLIDDLVGRCAVLERDRVTAAAAERTLLAGLHQELRVGLEDLSRTLAALGHSHLDEGQRDLVDPAVVSVGALADLVTGLRDLAPERAGGAPQDSAAFDLRDAVKGVIQFLARRATERSIELVCTIAQDVPPVVVGDRALLRQIALHLAHAAVRIASSPGRVDVEVSVDALADDHAAVRIAVSHRGVGISQTALRAADGESAPDGAAPTGEASELAGLAVARRLVERLGGRLGVESVENERFALWFTIIWQRPDRHAADRRADNRLRVSSVESSVGPVLDLSLGGARVQSRKRLAGAMNVEIRAGGEAVTLAAEVSWSRRAGLRRFESGLRFLDVTPEAARKLTRISMQHRVRAMLGGDG